LIREPFLNDCSDESLVLAAQAADKNAYAVLVRRHYKQVFLQCLGILGNVHDAEDVAQDAMLKGFERIKMLRDGSRFGQWIAVIAKNLCINIVRRRKSADKVMHIKLQEPAESTTLLSLSKSNDGGNLQWAIAKLPQEMRLPLVMYYFDGKSVTSVAEKLGLSPSGVYLKLRTAVKQLHEILVSHGESI
jgi:RNA polymerase sigma-70 factor (ECF subfamily)